MKKTTISVVTRLTFIFLLTVPLLQGRAGHASLLSDVKNDAKKVETDTTKAVQATTTAVTSAVNKATTAVTSTANKVSTTVETAAAPMTTPVKALTTTLNQNIETSLSNRFNCGGSGQPTCAGLQACNPGYYADSVQTDLAKPSSALYSALWMWGDPVSQTLCQPKCPGATAVKTAPLDVTFVITHDIHFGNTPGTVNVSCPVCDDVSASHVKMINSLPTIGIHPAGVVIAGDLTHSGDTWELEKLRALWEPGRTNAIEFPVYFGLGNHDIVEGSSSFKFYPRRRMQSYMKFTMGSGCGGVSNYHENSANYSWNWGNVHLIQLNTKVTEPNKSEGLKPSDPDTVKDSGGLAWLNADLAANSNKIIVLFQHYGLDSFSTELNSDGTATWWSDAERTTLYNAIKNYKVAGLFTGHTHVSPNLGGIWQGPNTKDPVISTFVGHAGGGMDSATGGNNTTLPTYPLNSGFETAHIWTDSGSKSHMTVQYYTWSKQSATAPAILDTKNPLTFTKDLN